MSAPRKAPRSSGGSFGGPRNSGDGSAGGGRVSGGGRVFGGSGGGGGGGGGRSGGPQPLRSLDGPLDELLPSRPAPESQGSGPLFRP